MKLSTLTTILLGSLGLVLTGCGNLHDESVGSEVSALAEDSGAASTASDQLAALISVPLQPIADPAALGSPEAAANAAGGGKTYFQPAGCVTVSKGLTTVSYELKGCTGPLGLVAVNGKLTASFSPAPSAGAIKVAVVSEGLVIGKIPVELSAQGTIAFAGSKRLLSWTGSYNGTSATGRKLTHTGSYSGSFDEATSCLELEGSASTKLGIHGVDTVTKGYKRCNGCPEAGTITATGAVSKLSIAVTYLGGGQAQLTVPSGKVYPYTMGWCL